VITSLEKGRVKLEEVSTELRVAEVVIFIAMDYVIRAVTVALVRDLE